ncbi:hypothetical protein [Bacillus sp. S10(2024)]|uniref:hypothetical protein n=1 Tax=Bacillus sp. S10(2024) TaxID=3162886 RepID=UPI003D2100C2
MKVITHLLLLFSLVITVVACKNENLSNSILSVGKPTENNDIHFTNTDENKKIRIINEIFNNKKWDVNKEFDVRGKIPDLVLEINNPNKGLPSLSVMIFFNENGADVINFKAEYTVLNNVEAKKVREAAGI